MTYIPQPGDEVTVCRWSQPTLTPGDPRRELVIQVTGRVQLIKNRVLWLDEDGLEIVKYAGGEHGKPLLAEYTAHSLDYTFLGGDPREGSCRYLVTGVYSGRLPGEPERRKIVHRFVVQPDVNVAIEDSGNILVQLVHPGTGEELARSGPLSNCDKLADALTLARVWRDGADDLASDRTGEDKPAEPACCLADKFHDPILAEPGCAQKWAG